VSALLLSIALAAAGPINITASPYSAVADDGNDDRAAIQSAIDAAGAGGVVYIPCGTFDVSVASGQVYGLYLFAIDGVTIRGEGPCSVLRAKFASSTGPTNHWLIHPTGVSRLRIESLTLDGNSPYLTSAGEHLHLIRATDAGGLVVKNVQFRNSWGDAIMMTSSAADYVYPITSINDDGSGRALKVTHSSGSGVITGGRYRIYGTSRYNGVYTVASQAGSVVTMKESFAYEVDSGEPATESTGTMIPYAGDVLISDSIIDGMGRSGVTMQKWTGDTTIRGVTFRHISDQAIDMEPGTVAGPRRVLLDDVRIFSDETVHLVMALAGGSTSESDSTIDVTLSNSYVEGEIDLIYSGPLTIANTTVRSGARCVTGGYKLRDTLITGSHFYCGPGNGIYLPALTSAARGFKFVGNYLDIGHDSSGAKVALTLSGGVGRTIISGNHFLSRQTGSSGNIAIDIEAKASSGTVRGVIIEGNIFEGFTQGAAFRGDGAAVESAVYDDNAHIDTGIAAGGIICTATSGITIATVKLGENTYGTGTVNTSCTVP